MSAATATKRRTPAQPAATPAEAPQAPEAPSAGLTFEMRDSLLKRLYFAGAAVSMLCIVFANEPQIEEPKGKIAGLMGVLQYARRELDALHIEIMDAGYELDDLYWLVYGASSLVALLEEVEWADSFDWSIGESMACDYLMAAQDCIKRAIDHLEGTKVHA